MNATVSDSNVTCPVCIENRACLLRSWCRTGKGGLFLPVILLFLVFSGTFHASSARAQVGTWKYAKLTHPTDRDGAFKYNPQVEFDRYGNQHLVWVSQDPNSVGLQLFYTNNTTGKFTSPVLATDIGTIYDSVEIDTNSFVFHMDPAGNAHLAFITNDTNLLRLYYTNNKRGGFGPGSYLKALPTPRYDMAVDSTGVAHVIWLSMTAGFPQRSINVYYWNSTLPPGQEILLGNSQCDMAGNGCQMGDPQLEVWRDTLEIAFRADSSTIYYIKKTPANMSAPTAAIRLPSLPYDSVLTAAGDADLRIRMALDSVGNVHIVVSDYNRNRDDGAHQLSYITNRGGLFTRQILANLDTLCTGFDIAGGTRLSATWSTYSQRFPANKPKVAYAERILATDNNWQFARMLPDLNVTASAPVSEWKNGMNIATYGDRVAISGTWRSAPPVTANQHVLLFTRTSTRPQLAYLIPDAAAPGMSVVVEGVAGHNLNGSFGEDGFNPEASSLELVNTFDTARIVVGPTVISWDGRLASTMLFIKPGAMPGPVPVRMRTGDMRSNVDTFYIVQAQKIGSNGSGRLEGGGFLGSGGIFGKRSRRGTLVLDSLTLTNGIYAIDTTDTDPYTPGNQGFLPATILVRGPIYIDSTAELFVSAIDVPLQSTYGTAGPGGGGGGAGEKLGGGSGYTGGGGPSWYLQDNGNSTGAAPGTGGELSAKWVAGPGLNGVRGGATFPGVAAGGGTGHPFGTSGNVGQRSQYFPVDRNKGGYGAGTAGTLDSRSGFATGGGGGGYATPGETGDPNFEDNGGRIVSSPALVPLAGGSGGGGAFSPDGVVNGGGGGGGLALFSFREMQLYGAITANGANGVDGPALTNSSGGGGGSGGGVVIGAQGSIIFGEQGKVVAKGGAGGTASGQRTHKGGDGGYGRVRFDGRADYIGLIHHDPLPQYFGPASGMSGSFQAQTGAVVHGYGLPGSRIRVFARSEWGNWNYSAPYDTDVDTEGAWEVALGAEAEGPGNVYVAVMQRIDIPSSEEYTARPEWVMSSAGGNILGKPNASVNVAGIDFDCLNFNECDTASIVVTNTGSQSDLIISNQRLVGGKVQWFTLQGAEQIRIAPGESQTLRMVFCARDTGSAQTTLTFTTNIFPDSIRQVPLQGCGLSGRLATVEEIDLGALCIGECRDTSIVIENKGDAPLVVDDVSTGSPLFSLESFSESLPITIPPGGTRTAQIRICVHGFDKDPPGLILKANTAYASSNVILFHVQNAGPEPGIPSRINLDPVDIGLSDSCSQRILTIRNRSAVNAFKILEATSTAPFTIVNSPEGKTVLPGGFITTTIQFCPPTVGLYAGVMTLKMETDNCVLDTVIQLEGEAIQSEAELVITEPVGDPLKVQYAPVLIGTETGNRAIKLENIGNGLAEGITVRVEAIAPTVLDEIIIDNSSPLSFDLGANSTQEIRVRMKPAAADTRNGMVIFNARGGWADTVMLCVLGLQPGVHATPLLIDFGDVRVGSALRRELTVINVGTAPTSIDRIEQTDSVYVVQVSSTHPNLPVTLTPFVAGDTIRILYQFSPDKEGAFFDQALVYHSSEAQPITVQLTGRGVREHVAVDQAVIDFGCIAWGAEKDSVDAITVRNTGGYPLTVTGIHVIQGAEAFSIPFDDFPNVIPVNGTMFYPVRYTAGATVSTGLVEITGSAPEIVQVALRGEVCQGDERYFTVSMPEAHASIGDYIVIPVSATFDGVLPVDIDYTLTVTYAYDMLAPLVAPRPDSAAPVLAGAISTSATMQEGHNNQNGVLTVQGMVPKGATSGMLVGIPMKVLLGSSYKTPLLVDAVLDAGAYIVANNDGFFIAIDCDTSGAVNILGSYILKQNLPNPFTGTTTIPYEIARRERVQINLYDGTGNFIQTVFDEIQDAGTYEFRLDALDFPTGIYTYEIISGRFRKTRRMVLVE